MKLKANLNELRQAGDYCIVDGYVIMACPICAGVFFCPHEIVQENPLTLSPSIVGPEEVRDWKDQILGPCGHHFWVKDGEVIDAS